MNPLISIVIPSYNASKYIHRCLYSILDQIDEINEKIEVVVVNDGSTDDTEAIVQTIIKSNIKHNVNLISIKNGGLANARNVGIDMAKGQYFINLDADDFFQIGILEALIAEIEHSKPDCCFYGFQDFEEDSGNVCGKYEERFNYINKAIDGETAFIKKMSKHIWICQGSACYRKNIFIDNNLYNIPGINQGEDFLFILSFLACCSKVTSIPIIGVNISYRSDSMMHARFNDSHLQVFDAIDELHNRIAEIHNEVNKSELLEWINIAYENERMAVTKKIIMAEFGRGYRNIKNIYIEKIPAKREFKADKMSKAKRIESWILNHSLLAYCFVTKIYMCVKTKVK